MDRINLVGVRLIVCLLLSGCSMTQGRDDAPEPDPAAGRQQAEAEDVPSPVGADPAPAPEAYEEAVPATTRRIGMLPVARTADGRGGFWMSATEVVWDVFDVFVYGLDVGEDETLDGVTRPSKPYIPPDRGFGHEGFPAMSMSFHAAEEFCRWLTKRTGHAYRLPTEDEWEHACRAGGRGTWSFGDDEAALEAYAWFDDNADDQTQAVAQKKPNAWGLFDMHGNVGEWCVGRDGAPIVRGGSYQDTAGGLACDVRLARSPSWNLTDPQIPKSRWWMADCPFVGFRIVRDFD